MSTKKRAARVTPDQGNVYDRIFRQVMNDLALSILGRFDPIPISSIQRLTDKLETTTQREADFLSKVTTASGECFILHIEFQSQDDREMLARMQEYHGILTRKYRLPIRHYVFYFGDRPTQMDHQLDAEMVFKGFQLFTFKDIDYRQLLDSDTGKEVLLAILADFQDTPPEVVIRLIIGRLRRLSGSKEELKAYLGQLTILSRLRNLDAETVKSTNAMPLTIDVEQDYLYNQGLEKGLEKGNILKEIEKVATTVKDDLVLLIRMVDNGINLAMMQTLSDVPAEMLTAFVNIYTAEKGQVLLSQIEEVHTLSEMTEVLAHLRDALENYGLATDLTAAYLTEISA